MLIFLYRSKSENHIEYGPFYDHVFSVFVDYILARSKNTLEFDCIENVSTSLPVTITDMDGIVLIPLFDMRSGIDQAYILNYITIW